MYLHMKRTLLLVLSLLFGGAIFSQNKGINYEARAIHSSKYWLDIDYVGDNIIGHRLDIHLPAAGEGPFPVVIAIYGSAWFGNSRKADTFSNGLGQHLLKNGFAVVSINHRSSRDGIFPAQIQDVKAAIRFIRANSETFTLDSTFIGITGWSSGGHLAAMAGTTSGRSTYQMDDEEVDLEGNLGAFTDASSHVDAVVDWFGPTDFLIMDNCGSSFSHDAPKSPESSLVGGPIQENPVLCSLANPITYVQKEIPPFLIIHGDQDPLVPHCQSEKLYAQMKTAKSESELIIVPGGKHGPKVMVDEYYKKMISFFEEQFKLKRTNEKD